MGLKTNNTAKTQKEIELLTRLTSWQ